MPSRRSSASTSPRFVQAAACRTIRSFSDAENDRLLPRLGTLSTETPLGRGAAPDAEGAGAAATEPGGGGSAATATPPERGAAPGAAGAGAGATEPRGGGSAATATPPERGAAPGAAGAGAGATEPRGGGSAATATPLGRGAAPGAAGAGLTDRRREGLGTGQVHPPPSLHRFREEAVSAHVGTGGDRTAGRNRSSYSGPPSAARTRSRRPRGTPPRTEAWAR